MLQGARFLGVQNFPPTSPLFMDAFSVAPLLSGAVDRPPVILPFRRVFSVYTCPACLSSPRFFPFPFIVTFLLALPPDSA